MDLEEWAGHGETSVINTQFIPSSVTQEYRRDLLDYHPDVGARMSTRVIGGNLLRIDVEEEEWPDATREVMESLEFVPTPVRGALVAKPGFRSDVGLWTLHNVTMEKIEQVPEGATLHQQLLLQWSFPGHEFVFTVWKWTGSLAS